jgi:hypothetical protein
VHKAVDEGRRHDFIAKISREAFSTVGGSSRRDD